MGPFPGSYIPAPEITSLNLGAFIMGTLRSERRMLTKRADADQVGLSLMVLCGHGSLVS